MGDADLVTPSGLRIAHESLTWRFTRSSGAGGQHVNTADTKVTLTCELAEAGLPDDVTERLVQRLGSSVTVVASGSRSQWRNRQEARERLAARLDGAVVNRRARRATRPSRGAQEARLAAKHRSSQRKSERRWRPDQD